MTTTSTTPSKEWSAYSGLPLLRTIATGIVQLDKLAQPGEQAYPRAAQRALDQLVLLCLRRGVPPPRSVPDLVHWARTVPVGKWPLELPEDATGAGEILVDPDTRIPTQVCREWAVDGADATAEQIENQLMLGAIEACRAHQSPASYTAFRTLLIDRPVLTGSEIAGLLGEDFNLSPVLEFVKQSYLPVPASLQRGGTVAVCDRCKCLLVPLADGQWRCELDRCRAEGPTVIEHERAFREPGGLFQVTRPLRVFITGPGRAEVELRDALIKLGLTVTMWPQFDTYDLHIKMPFGNGWAIDVKDRANPALLGRSAKAFGSPPPYDRAYLTVPGYRVRQRPDYLRVFARHRPAELADRVELVTNEELVRVVTRELRTSRNVAAHTGESAHA